MLFSASEIGQAFFLKKRKNDDVQTVKLTVVFMLGIAALILSIRRNPWRNIWVPLSPANRINVVNDHDTKKFHLPQNAKHI